MHVLRALLFLRLTTLRNRLLGNLRRARQPKYFLGLAAAALYFWFFFFRRAGPMGNPQFMSVFLGDGRAELGVALMVSLFVLLMWLTPGEQPGLAFTEAEIAFLFPAPLTRRQLIHYKLIDGLVMSLVGAFFFTLISSGVRHNPAGALRHLGAWWSLNANLALHQTAAALTIAKLSSLGLRTAWRRTLLVGVTGAGAAAALFVALESGPEKLAWLLWPARLAIRPFLAPDLGTYLLALLPAAGLVAVHYLWVHRMETPFEDASIVRARKVGETVERIRAGRGFGAASARARREPFRLGDRLPVEAALLWKNLMAAPAWLNRRTFLGAAAVIVVGLNWFIHWLGPGGAKFTAPFAFVALTFLVYALVFGPQLVRVDLRGDLHNADLFKAWPLPGWRIVLGSLLAPAVILTAVAWLLLLVAGLTLVPPSGKAEWLTPGFRLAAGLSLAVIMPFLCTVQLLVPNAATVLFPAWAQNARGPHGGFDVMGQRMIFFAGQLLCLVLALLPAVLLAAATIFLTQWLVGLPAAVALATLPVILVLAGEVWLGVRLLGPRFEKLDISAELRP